MLHTLVSLSLHSFTLSVHDFCLLDCATTVAVASIAFVASVVDRTRLSLVSVASLPPTLLMRSNNTNVEHLLINSYEFTSRIQLFSIH